MASARCTASSAARMSPEALRIAESFIQSAWVAAPASTARSSIARAVVKSPEAAARSAACSMLSSAIGKVMQFSTVKAIGSSPCRRSPIADPLGQNPLFARRRRKTGVERQRLGLPCIVHIGPEECIAGVAPVADSDLRKFGLAAFEFLVEIDEEGRDPLSVRAQLLLVLGVAGLEKIQVPFEFLANLIVEDLRQLEHGYGDAGRCRDTRPDNLQHHVHVR